MLISPSILSVYKNGLEETLKELETVKSDLLHVDVMDNKFVPNFTFDHTFVNALHQKTNLILDTHLMIENPDDDYSKYIQAGSTYLTFHFEATKQPLELIGKIKKAGSKVGISIKPDTPVEVLDSLLKHLDLVLVMSVEPGFGGQKFRENAPEKIVYLDNKRKENNYHYLIEVDGGINENTAKLVKDAGCDIIVVGSYLMNSNSITNTYKLLKEI